MADQMINGLPVKTAPQTGDKLLVIGTAEEQLIDYDKIADAILTKLTSKTFTLDQGSMTLLAALNALNSNFKNKSLKVIKTLEGGSEIKAEITNGFCSLWVKLKNGDIPTVKTFSQGIIFNNIPEEYCPPCTISTDFTGVDKKGMLDGCYASITKEGKIWMLTRYAEVSAEINSSSAIVYFYYPVKN